MEAEVSEFTGLIVRIRRLSRKHFQANVEVLDVPPGSAAQLPCALHELYARLPVTPTWVMLRCMDGFPDWKTDLKAGTVAVFRGRQRQHPIFGSSVDLVECTVLRPWSGPPFEALRLPHPWDDRGSSVGGVCRMFVSQKRCCFADCPYLHPEGDALYLVRRDFAEKRHAMRRAAAVQSVLQENDDPHTTHVATKANRAPVFAQFLLQYFGAQVLSSGSGVIDVAGGRGQLSFELYVELAIPCTLVEPRDCQKRSRAQHKYLKLTHQENPHIPQLRRQLDSACIADNTNLFATCSALVGMHPDEATEAIIDAALQLAKPFAVVPCCIFSNKFPGRNFLAPDGSVLPVESYEDFLCYLQQKGPPGQIQRATLPFIGKNEVLYFGSTHI